jgi:hypothetical protein
MLGGIAAYARRHHLALLALFLALGGTSFAAANALAPNSVGTKQLRKNAVTSSKIRKNAINGTKVASNSLTGADILESRLGKVPSAGKADSATNATNATSATNATHASNADQLGGISTAGYARSTLPSGQTESGDYAVAGSVSGDHMVEGVQFAIPLAAPLDSSHVEFRPFGTTSANCPGVGQATAGYLCVYESDFAHRSVVSDSVSDHLIYAGADAYGFIIWLVAADVDGWSTGSWTVKAP